MTMNRAYRLFRLCLVLLPFGVMVLFLLNTFKLDSIPTGVQDIFSQLTNCISAWSSTFEFIDFSRPLQEILVEIFPSALNNAAAETVIRLLSWYIFLFMMDIVVCFLTFIPRWIVDRFGGDMV